MDRQLFVDRLLETENLTDQLEDDDANSLLNWGISQIDGLIDGIDDDDTAGEKISQLMHVMRGLNSLAGNLTGASHETIVDLLDRYGAMVGQTMEVEQDERRSVAEQISNMQPGEAIRFLHEWLQAKGS